MSETAKKDQTKSQVFTGKTGKIGWWQRGLDLN
jgi:hypothetical protein